MGRINKLQHKHNWIPVSSDVNIVNNDGLCLFVCGCGLSTLKKMRLLLD